MDEKNLALEAIRKKLVGKRLSYKEIYAIMDEISKGIKKHVIEKNLFKIADRKEAINFAINLAERGDTVLLTGKGHEKSMNYGRGEEPWDETGIALAAVRERFKS